MKNYYTSSLHCYFSSSLKSYELYGVAGNLCLPQMHFAMKQQDRLKNEMRFSPDWRTRDEIKHQVLNRFPHERLRFAATQLNQSCFASEQEYICLIEKALETYALLEAVCKGNIHWDWRSKAWQSI